MGQRRGCHLASVDGVRIVQIARHKVIAAVPHDAAHGYRHAAPSLSGSALGLNLNVLEDGGLQGVLQHHAGYQLDLALLHRAGLVHVGHVGGHDAGARGADAVEAVQTQHNGIDGGRTFGGRSRRAGGDHVHGSASVVVLAAVHQGDAVVGLHHAAKIVPVLGVVTGPAGAGAHLGHHFVVHQQHGRSAVHGADKRIQLVQKRLIVAVHGGAGGQVNGAGKLVGSAIQQLLQAVEGAGHIAGTRRSGSSVDDEVVEIVAGGLDLLLGLERQFIHSAGGVLQHAVDLEGTAHDNGLGGLFLALRLASGVFAVDGTHGGGAGGLELDIAVGQGAAARAGGNGVVKGQTIQQQRGAPESVDNGLVYVVSHADLGFRKSNRHNSHSPLLFVVFLVQRFRQGRGRCGFSIPSRGIQGRSTGGLDLAKQGRVCLFDGLQHGLGILQAFAVQLHLVQVNGAEHQVNGGGVGVGGFQRFLDKRFLARVGLLRLHLLLVGIKVGLYLGRVSVGLFQRFHALLEGVAFLRCSGKVFRALLRLFDLVLQRGHGLAVGRDDLLDLVFLDAEGLQKFSCKSRKSFHLSVIRTSRHIRQHYATTQPKHYL
nr:MAG TPA: hypothetical protein [Caudoviricetes sp.]